MLLDGDKHMKTKELVIKPNFDTHFRYLFVFAIFSILLSLFILWLSPYNISAVEIPVSLLAGPSIHTNADTDGKVDFFINSHTTEEPIDLQKKMLLPTKLDPPSDVYHTHSLTSLSVDKDPLAKLPEVRQKVEVHFTVSYFRKKKREDAFSHIIIEAANRYNVDPAIIKAIIMAESSYNPKAVSYRGAGGLMQLMPRTAKALGVKDIFNPEQNITAGVKYFKQLLEQFNGDTSLALAAYNAGSRKVRKYKGVPPFKATKKYIKNVMKYRKIYEEELKG